MTIPAGSSTAKTNQLTSDQLELWKKTVSERLSDNFEPGTSEVQAITLRDSEPKVLS